MKQFLNEDFNIKTGILNIQSAPNRPGSNRRCIILTLSGHSNAYNVREILKRYGAKYSATTKQWGWPIQNYADNLDELYNNIRQCMAEIRATCPEANGHDINAETNSVLNNDNTQNFIRQALQATHEIANNLANQPEEITARDGFGDTVTLDVNALNAQVRDFYNQLANTLNSAEYEEMLNQVLSVCRYHGYKFSFNNMLLALIQMRQLGLTQLDFMCASDWKKQHYHKRANATPIWLFAPRRGNNNNLFKTQDERNAATQSILQRNGLTDTNQLGQRGNAGVSHQVDVELRKVDTSQGWIYQPYWYDISQMEPDEGWDGENNMHVGVDAAEQDTTETSQLALHYLRIIKNYMDTNHIPLSAEAQRMFQNTQVRNMNANGNLAQEETTEEVAQANIGAFKNLVRDCLIYTLTNKYNNWRFNNDRKGKNSDDISFNDMQLNLQAELGAYYICKRLYLDYPNSVQNLAVAGITSNNVQAVFKGIMKDADDLLNKLTSVRANQTAGNQVPGRRQLARRGGAGQVANESINRFMNIRQITPGQFATMVGATKLFETSVKKEKHAIYESFYGILNRINS